MRRDVVDQYLRHYAETASRTLPGLCLPHLAGLAGLSGNTGARWSSALVLPSFRETGAFLGSLSEASACASGRVLCVLVVNAPEDAAAADLAINSGLVAELRSRCRSWVALDVGSTLFMLEHVDLLTLDRSAEGFRLPRRQAVGLARKIGNDVALGLWRAGAVESPWLYQSDADAMLPAGHFLQRLPDTVGAVVFSFRHVCDGDAAAHLQTLKHEAWLRYHVIGLRWARSRYAWHSIGSCIAVHAEAYAMVRGFPKRDAGEDFHLLQKVCKVSTVHSVAGDPVRIRSRASNRVPLGTGPAVARLLLDPSIRFESPTCYELLRDWLEALRRFAGSRDLACLEDDVRETDGTGALAHVLDELGVSERLSRLSREATTSADLHRRIHDWFDGIKTLRLLHGLRAQAHPELPAGEALSLAPFAWLGGRRGAGGEHPNSRVGDERWPSGAEAWENVCRHLERLELSGQVDASQS